MSGWVAMDKALAGTFHEIRREYSKIEAMYSLSLDINCGENKSYRAYSRMWSWSVPRVIRFIKSVTPALQQRDTSVTPFSLILLKNKGTALQQRDSNVTPALHKYKEQEQEQYKKTMSRKGNATRKIPYKKIVDYLNEKAETRFTHTAKATQRHIKARFNEGFTEENFYTVIDAKTNEWKTNERMVQFIRPLTLFSAKFESYLQAAGGGDSGEIIKSRSLVDRVLQSGRNKTPYTAVDQCNAP